MRTGLVVPNVTYGTSAVISLTFNDTTTNNDNDTTNNKNKTVILTHLCWATTFLLPFYQ